jgi:hypothetical protein
MVHDSDVLYLTLFDKGLCADRYVSRPDYFDDTGDAWRRAVQGAPAKWTPVIPDAEQRKRLREAWDRDTVFAGDMLPALGQPLGIASDLLASGVNAK